MAMFGGGGFDAGNQFAGGGFMPSQAQDNAFGGGGGGGGSGGRKNNQSQTLRAFTLRQLAKYVDDSDGDNLRVDGADINNVTVVGNILSVQDSNMRLSLVISDGTGQLEMTHFINDDSPEAVAAKKAELRPGTYVRAYGHLKSHEGRRTMTAFSLRVITDYNEVTYHLLRVVFEHLHLTKGGAAQPQADGGAGGMGGMGMAGGGWGGAPQQQGGGGATAYAGGGSGLGPCGDAIIAVIRTSNSENGMHVQEVYNKLNGQFNQQQVYSTLQQLVGEAHVYTTIDDDHFQAA